MTAKTKSIFITLEGIEGVGKSTALQFLEKFFQEQNLDYVLTREPGGTEIAESIRQLILEHHTESMASDTELLLMFASRAQHIAKVIKPALAASKIVLSDRFTDATYAYQGGGRGISFDRIATLESWVQGHLQPDLTILLDAPIEVGLNRILSRGAKDRIEQEKIEFFHRVREAYLQRAEQFGARFKIIDATQTIAKVQAELRTTISHYISV
ncbi:MAG: dTMP kinase [Gammaproteobacteria bacterium]|nr:dTMP kinase [Gammaproteobacteria bacterium]